MANKRADLVGSFYCFERTDSRSGSLRWSSFPHLLAKAIEAINSVVIRKEWQQRLCEYELIIEPAWAGEEDKFFHWNDRAI